MWPLITMIVGAVVAAFVLALLVRYQVSKERKAP